MILTCYSCLQQHFLFSYLPEPCTPQNLFPSVNCDTHVISLSWDASNGTQLYNVSAEAGNNKTELATNATTAHFSGLRCGQNYTLAVAPQSRHCASTTSAEASIQTCRFHTSSMASVTGIQKQAQTSSNKVVCLVSQGRVHQRESPPRRTVSLPS